MSKMDIFYKLSQRYKALAFKSFNGLIEIVRRNLDSTVLFLFCVGVFCFLMMYVSTDIGLHLIHIVEINARTKSYPSNFAFYLVINFFSGFSSNMYLQAFNAILLLSICTVAKYVISKNILIELNSFHLSKERKGKLSLLAIALFFCFAIPDPFSILILKKYYLGRFVPIVWHNSTTIFLFPFAILLFWRQLKILNDEQKLRGKEVWLINVLVIINTVIKPSFIFVYAPITFFFLLNKIKSFSIRDFVLNFSPLFTSIFILLIQYFFIYKLEMGSFNSEGSSVAVGTPFKIIGSWIPLWYIPIALIASFALPIVTAILYKEILKYKPFVYSLFLTITGLIISFFVYETGPRMYDGNFTWQNVICSYLLFLSTIAFLSPKLLDRSSWQTKDLIIIFLLALHVLSGVFYLIKIGLTFSFY